MIRKDNFVEILNPGNLQQLSLSNLSGQVARIYDKYSQSEVLSLSKTGKLLIPRTNRQHLGLSTAYLNLQIFIPHSNSFTLEISVGDCSVTRRKLIFTHCRGIQKDTLHSKISNSVFPRETWANICIDLAAFTGACFGYAFQEIDSIKIAGCCRIRRIFSSKLNFEEITLPINYQVPGNCAQAFVGPSSIEDTCSLLDISRRTQDENINFSENKAKNVVERKEYGQKIATIHKSSSHIPNKSLGYTNRKNKLLRPIDKVESIYENVINSLGTIRHSTPPFVHINDLSVYYDPISKSYIS